MFSTFQRQFFFLSRFILSSANAFNLDQLKNVIELTGGVFNIVQVQMRLHYDLCNATDLGL